MDLQTQGDCGNRNKTWTNSIQKNSQHRAGRGGQDFLPAPEELLTCVSCWEREREGWVPTRPGPTPKTNWATQTRLSGERKKKEEEKEEKEGEEKEKWGGRHGGGRRILKSNGKGWEGQEHFNGRIEELTGKWLCSKYIVLVEHW